MRVVTSLTAGSASGQPCGVCIQSQPDCRCAALCQVYRSRIHAVQLMQLCLQLTIIEDVQQNLLEALGVSNDKAGHLV